MTIRYTVSAFFLVIIAVLLLTSAPNVCAQEAKLSSDAPKDKPVRVKGQSALDKLEAAIAPYVKKARATLPQAKKRYLKGLNPGEIFYVTTKISEGGVENTRVEQIFVRVKSWNGTKISGTIESHLKMKSRKFGDKIWVDEKDVYDWLIAKPDGTEEGNVVGKFLDTY